MFAIILAALAVDFTAATGEIRPELHSSGFGPKICSQTAQELADIKSMGFKAARTHDWAHINSNERVCDYFHIFPLMRLDANDPENYVFGPTDYLLKRTREEAGLDVFYRLGTSIEHSGSKVHFNTKIPDDFDKMAEIFAATVRHYNRGWADGFNWGIRYWEIWNEPDGILDMWCPPEGTEGLSETELAAKKDGCRRQFVRFFVTVLKRLKGEFGDTVKVGGPALQTFRANWFVPIFEGCRKAGVAPDFISWHGYAHDPMQFNREAERARELCDSYGFTKCELIINEWHYFGENYDWIDMQHCSDPKVKARIWDGPDGFNAIRSACFTLATLANMQKSKLSQAYYYGCRSTGAWGFKDEMHRKYKVFYALKLFGDIVRDCRTICTSESEGTITTFAATGVDGRKQLLVIDCGGTGRRISLDIKGVSDGLNVRCRVLDHTHDLEPIDVSFKDGKLELVKPDFHSAAFIAEFDSRPFHLESAGQ